VKGKKTPVDAYVLHSMEAATDSDLDEQPEEVSSLEDQGSAALTLCRS
jgi:hypothetical protein